jgi:hypothetical protein
MIDTSGSMTNEIEEVKRSCIEFAETIGESEFDVRLGLVGFDIGGHQGGSWREQPYRVHNLSAYTIGVWPITTPEEFKQNAASLSVGLFGGGGCYLANSDTIDIFPYVVELFNDTDPTTRVLVIISDEMGDNSGLNKIVSRLTEASITTFVLGVAGSDGAHEEIARRTGGQFLDISEGRYDFRGLLTKVAEAIAEESKKRHHFKFERPRYSGDPQRAYAQTWASTHPGCLIVLLDQSGSMKNKFGGSQIGAGQTKASMVATVLNSLLHDLVKANTVGTLIKPRAEVAVIGYEGRSVRNALSGLLASKPFANLGELAANPLRVETRIRKEMADDGTVAEVHVPFPIWVEPHHGDMTPMRAAVQRACELAEEWAVKHLESYPPVIVNVTDGASTDGDPFDLAHELTKIHTNSGESLLFNCHITDLPSPKIEFPNHASKLPDDPAHLAKLLFSMSSIIPGRARANIRGATGRELPDGARGFIFNGDAGSLRDMFVFATIGAIRVDANR